MTAQIVSLGVIIPLTIALLLMLTRFANIAMAESVDRMKVRSVGTWLLVVLGVWEIAVGTEIILLRGGASSAMGPLSLGLTMVAGAWFRRRTAGLWDVPGVPSVPVETEWKPSTIIEEEETLD